MTGLCEHDTWNRTLLIVEGLVTLDTCPEAECRWLTSELNCYQAIQWLMKYLGKVTVRAT